MCIKIISDIKTFYDLRLSTTRFVTNSSLISELFNLLKCLKFILKFYIFNFYISSTFHLFYANLAELLDQLFLPGAN